MQHQQGLGIGNPSCRVSPSRWRPKMERGCGTGGPEADSCDENPAIGPVSGKAGKGMLSI